MLSLRKQLLEISPSATAIKFRSCHDRTYIYKTSANVGLPGTQYHLELIVAPHGLLESSVRIDRSQIQSRQISRRIIRYVPSVPSKQYAKISRTCLNLSNTRFPKPKIPADAPPETSNNHKHIPPPDVPLSSVSQHL